jgi:hypothetical protein
MLMLYANVVYICKTCIYTYITGEEALTGKCNEHAYGCFDQRLFNVVLNKHVCKKCDLASVLLNQLWGADCVTIETASQLTIYSLCLQ